MYPRFRIYQNHTQQPKLILKNSKHFRVQKKKSEIELLLKIKKNWLRKRQRKEHCVLWKPVAASHQCDCFLESVANKVPTHKWNLFVFRRFSVTEPFPEICRILLQHCTKKNFFDKVDSWHSDMRNLKKYANTVRTVVASFEERNACLYSGKYGA